MLHKKDQDLLSKTLSFWPHLTSTQQEHLISSASVVSYQKNQAIHTADSHCAGFLLLKSGSIRVYLLSKDGREITLYRIYPKDTCILSASCVLSYITFDVGIDAVSDCEAIQISPAVFSGLVRENIYAEAFSYQLTTKRFSDVMFAMQEILFLSFDKRLASFLLKESQRLNSSQIRETHEQIAKLLGSAREVVTRMLHYFSEEGLVTLSRGLITITDKKSLEELCYHD